MNSGPGEPLDATVPLFLSPGEQINSSCLSVGTREDFPGHENVLISNARLTFLGSQSAVHITTSKPVDSSAISLVIRVSCSPGQLGMWPINLHLAPTSSSPLSPMIDTTLPGTAITVRHGDSVYGLSRTIYPHNEKAVRDLAQAIVLANPALFPDGRGRPLQIGERLSIPDLRMVQQIVANSSAQHVSPDARAPLPISVPHTRRAAGQPLRTSGTLRLKLARSLDLSRSKRISEEQRALLRSQAGVAAVIRPAPKGAPQADSSSVLISRIQDTQDRLDARIARLEQAAVTLRKTIAQAPAQPPASLPASALPAATQPQTAIVAQPGSITTRYASGKSLKWIGLGGLMILLAIGAFFLGRKFQRHRALASQRMRIDEMLEQAHSEAMPLLGPEPALSARGEYSGAAAETQSGEPVPELHPEDIYDLSTEELQTTQAAPQRAEPSMHIPVLQPLEESTPGPSTPDAGSAAPDAPSEKLRLEMDQAMDSTRTMFSDVDRFITLGRIQNAISLLEFQIKRDPGDRGAWVKLMAVYRSQAMDGDFDRIYSAFRDHFGD